LTRATSGDNTDFSINFIPKMDYDTLINGYQRVVHTLYSPKHYYARVKALLRNYTPAKAKVSRMRIIHFKAAAKSVVRLGIIGRERWQYWKLLFWSLFRRPRLIPMAITLSIYGHHFRRVFRKRSVHLR
jgi:hypothetical protein